jgi:hypothetical protein
MASTCIIQIRGTLEQRQAMKVMAAQQNKTLSRMVLEKFFTLPDKKKNLKGK